MTIREVEDIYKIDKQDCEIKLKKDKKKFRIIACSISTILGIVGMCLLIWASKIPPTIYSSGYSYVNNFAQEIFGKIALIWAGCAFVFCWIAPIAAKVNYLPATKNLYQNYIRCVDMTIEDKEYYKELLAEIRHIEMTKAVNRASASVSGAILFSAIQN